MSYNKSSAHEPGNVLRVPETRSLLSGTRKMGNTRGKSSPGAKNTAGIRHELLRWLGECLALEADPKTVGAKELGERHC